MEGDNTKSRKSREGRILLSGHGAYGPDKSEVSVTELGEMTLRLEEENERLERRRRWVFR